MSDANGSSNGNGHDGKFSIEKKEDIVLAKVAPAARRDCCRDTDLTEGARMFFCYLVDAALTFGIYIRRGIVKFSDGDLGKEFKVDPKTIRNWKRALAASGRIWITERWNKNSFPTTVYNISALVGQPELPLEAESRNGDLVQHETFANSNRHPGRFLKRSERGKFSCRLHGVSGCTLCRQYTPPRIQPVKPLHESKTQESAANKAPERKILPSTEATDCRPQRQQIAAHNGNGLPTPSAKICRGEGKPVAVPDGKNLPWGAANGCRGQRQQIADNGKTGERETDQFETKRKIILSSSTVEQLNGVSGSPATKAFKGEKELLARMGRVCVPEELVNWGGRWRNRIRADAEKFERVLIELETMHREGKIHTNAGACADDLWKRFASHTAQPQKKAAVPTAA